MEAYVFIRAAPKKVSAVRTAVGALSGIKRVNACWGVPDIIALAEVGDLQALRDLVLTKVQAVDGVVETDSHIVIE